MATRNESSQDALKRAKEGADRHVRLVETLQTLAHAEEEAAAALLTFDLSQQADELLKRAVEHYRWAVQVAEQAKGERKLEFDLMSDTE